MMPERNKKSSPLNPEEMSIKKPLPFLLLIALISVSPLLMAQAPDEPSVDDPAVPVDGGLSLLLAAGAAYGGRRLYRKREKG
jgi:hypothetical protein